MELESYVRKGMRIVKPRNVNLKLRPVVQDWFMALSADAHCALSVLLVGILEDFYDQHKDEKEAP